MATRTTPARYPLWFAPSDGLNETYMLRFPDLTKFDDFKLITARRRSDVPLEQYKRVGVDILEYPSFGNPPFYDYVANPRSWYGIPDGRTWRVYLNSFSPPIDEAELSAPTLTARAQVAINYIADNLVSIENDFYVDQGSESYVNDNTVAYTRIFQRVAGRVTAQMAAGQRPFRPIIAGGYIFYSNGDAGFWQYDLAGKGQKKRPLRFERFFNGDWQQYNGYFASGRYNFMQQNHGSYWQGHNFTDGVYEILNGMIFRIYSRTQMSSVAAATSLSGTFTWDKCDNQRGSLTNKYEWKTTAPAGRLKLFSHIHPPVEWLRMIGVLPTVLESFLTVWNQPSRTNADPNWVGNNLNENNLSGNIFYPAGGGEAQAWPNAPVSKNLAPNTTVCEGLIDYVMLGFRQGYEIRRALGGRAASVRFLDFKIDGGQWITAQANLSDVLYASENNRGFVLEAAGPNGKKVLLYWTGYGDFDYHTLTMRRDGAEDTMTVFGNGLTYSDPF